MRLLLPVAALAAAGVAACSEETQDNAQEMVESAAADTAAAETVLSQGAEMAGDAAQDLAQKADETAEDADVVTPEEAAGQ